MAARRTSDQFTSGTDSMRDLVPSSTLTLTTFTVHEYYL